MLRMDAPLPPKSGYEWRCSRRAKPQKRYRKRLALLLLTHDSCDKQPISLEREAGGGIHAIDRYQGAGGHVRGALP